MSLESLQHKLSAPRTTVQLCILGIVAGSCAATIIILFRLSYEWLQLQFLASPDDFASIPSWQRAALPIGGVLGVLAIAKLTGFRHYRMGIPFVIHRVKVYYGRMPFRTTLNQFFGGMFALASGFSVGREGPSVHLGAAGSSFLGQWLKLPYNSIRILSGCGIAAGISASFNTPFAAVIFVMEVVLREYRIHIFMPVMLAAACGSVLTRSVFGEASELSFLEFTPLNQWLYFYLIIFGGLLGALATFFNSQLMRVIRLFQPIEMVQRLLLAGAITGAVGWVLPEALGAGMHSINIVINTPDNLAILSALLLAKIALTLIAIGLGVPGGLIGPVMGIGVLAGTLLLLPLEYVLGDTQSLTTSFGLLGLAALMTSVLHAPLAALSAVMELTGNSEVILPAMLVIVPSYVVATQFLGNRSVFIMQLDYQKLAYTTSSIREALQKVGVLELVDKEYKLFLDAPEKHILQFLEKEPTLPVVLRSSYEIDVQFHLVQYDFSLDPHQTTPLRYFSMDGVPAQATLAEVYEVLQRSREGAVYVHGATPNVILGVITWDTIRNYLNHQRY